MTFTFTLAIATPSGAIEIFVETISTPVIDDNIHRDIAAGTARATVSPRTEEEVV